MLKAPLLATLISQVQLHWTQQVLKHVLIYSLKLQLTSGSCDVLNVLPLQKHKRDNQRLRRTQRIGRTPVKFMAIISKEKTGRRNLLCLITCFWVTGSIVNMGTVCNPE